MIRTLSLKNGIRLHRCVLKNTFFSFGYVNLHGSPKAPEGPVRAAQELTAEVPQAGAQGPRADRPPAEARREGKAF